MSSAFKLITQGFQLLKLRVYIQFKEDTTLPSYKGAMLRGWLGHSLKAVDERAFFAFFGSHDDQQPKPYVINPSDDLKSIYHSNEFYTFDILLFGASITLSPVLLKALKYGQKLGLGESRAPFNLVSVASITPKSIVPGIEPTSLSDWLIPRNISTQKSLDEWSQTEIALQFKTPVRIKLHGRVLNKEAPNLSLLLKQVARRVAHISTFWVTDDDNLIKALYLELPALGDYEANNHVYYEDWQRYSLKQQTLQPYGGLKGQVSYFGEIREAIPWLKVGEQLHIGGKTTFGLGNYQLIC